MDAKTLDVAAALHDPMPGMFIPRELWQPCREDQIGACETLLASHIPAEVRLHVRDLYEDLKRTTL